MNQNHKEIVVGISGASGVIYAQRLVDLLEQASCRVHVVVTEPARQILIEELSITELNAEAFLGRASDQVNFHDNGDLFNLLASGSYPTNGMVVCPCTSHSLAALAAGLADTLLLRSAYVTLKQQRPLLLVHREIPLTSIDMQNMLTLNRAGGIICPACPAFYMEPKTINDLVDSVIGRVLDLLHIKHDLPIRWSP